MKYAINENELYAEIQDCISDYESWSKFSEILKIENQVYGYVFESTMTGITVAVVSNDINDVEDITASDMQTWLEQVQNDEAPYNSYNGLSVETDENGHLNIVDNMLVFDKPLDEIIDEIQSNGRMSVGDIERKIISDYATKEKIFMWLDGDAYYPQSEVVPVGYDKWSF